jgi:hypothetical protein
VKEGNTLETDEENLTELVQQTERFEKKQVPVLRTGGFWGLALLDAGIGSLEIKSALYITSVTFIRVPFKFHIPNIVLWTTYGKITFIFLIEADKGTPTLRQLHTPLFLS